MRVQVRFEHSSGHEASPTEMTAVRFLSGVRAHVLLQVTGLLKALITHIAPEKIQPKMTTKTFAKGVLLKFVTLAQMKKKRLNLMCE